MGASAATPLITLRPLRDSDAFLMHRWLGDPHVISGFGSRTAAEAVLAVARQSSSAAARIIERASVSIGYVQAVDTAELGSPYLRAYPGGWMELDGFIGAPSWRAQGCGAAALASLRDELFETTLCLGAAALVPITRETTVRGLEHHKFGWRTIVDEPTRGRCWLLISERA